MTTLEPQIAQLRFTHLPGFAEFILKNRLNEYVAENIRLIKEKKLPLLKYLESMSEEQMIASSKISSAEFLTAIIENKVSEHLEKGQQRWIKNEIPGLARDKIKAEDLIILFYISKQVFLKFIPEYTNNTSDIIEIVKELDLYCFTAETQSTTTLINILKEDVNTNTHFIEQIANTTPGILYVYDVVEKKQIYNNQMMVKLLGYTMEEINNEERGFSYLIVHPDDMDTVKEYNKHFLENGKETNPVEFRVRDKQGIYHWIRAYESPFKKDENGNIIQKIGIALNIDAEKKFSEELAFHEEQLLEAQELAQMGSFIWDFNNRENTSMTPQLMNIFEMDGVGKMDVFLTKVHPADRQKVEDAIKASLETGFYECEYRYMASTGEKILWSRGVITYVNNEPLYMKGTVMDVTNRHHMIQRLQRSEDLYKQAQSLTHIGNSVWDLIQDRLTWSDELFRIYGLEPGSEIITYDTIFSFMHPDDLESIRKYIEESLETGEPYDFFYRIILRSGEIKTLHTKGEVRKDEKGKAYKMVGTVQDVTEQKRTEKMLNDNQHFIQKIADTAPSIIAAYNINTGQYIFVNQAVEQLLGYDREQILKEGAAFFIKKIHPDDVDTLMQENQDALQKANEQKPGDPEMVVEFKYRMQHINGNYKWFHTYGTIFERDELGKVKHVLNISVDINEIVKAEKILSQKNSELEKSNSNLEEFAYVASHDLQEPLRKIKIFGDRLQDRSKDILDETAQLYLEKILNATDRMSRLIKDLLDYSRLSRPGEKLIKTDLNEVLNNVLSDFELLIVQKHADVESEKLPVIDAIPLQMNQLFYNLISNSLKFSVPDKKPLIKITLSKPPAKEITAVGLDKSFKWHKITFADNGIGFNPEFSEKIFMIFQRLNGVHDYPGTGIGLTLCRKIANNHLGTITANAAEGKGAEFHVYLPATQLHV